MEIKNLQDKVLSFLDKNSNLVLIAILIFALILRLKYLNINESEVDINKPSEILYNLSKNCNFYFIDLYSYFKKYKNREIFN